MGRENQFHISCHWRMLPVRYRMQTGFDSEGNVYMGSRKIPLDQFNALGQAKLYEQMNEKGKEAIFERLSPEGQELAFGRLLQRILKDIADFSPKWVLNQNSKRAA